MPIAPLYPPNTCIRLNAKMHKINFKSGFQEITLSMGSRNFLQNDMENLQLSGNFRYCLGNTFRVVVLDFSEISVKPIFTQHRYSLQFSVS